MFGITCAGANSVQRRSCAAYHWKYRVNASERNMSQHAQDD